MRSASTARKRIAKALSNIYGIESRGLEVIVPLLTEASKPSVKMYGSASMYARRSIFGHRTPDREAVPMRPEVQGHGGFPEITQTMADQYGIAPRPPIPLQHPMPAIEAVPFQAGEPDARGAVINNQRGEHAFHDPRYASLSVAQSGCSRCENP